MSTKSDTMVESPTKSISSNAGCSPTPSDRNLSSESLKFYSSDDQSLARGTRLVPIRNAIADLSRNPTFHNDDDTTTFFPSRLGGPEELPFSVNDSFPRSGEHRWTGWEEDKQHPMCGQSFILYYGPSFRKPTDGWSGNERIDWLQHVFERRRLEERKGYSFDEWSRTEEADGWWTRRLQDKACQYYIEHNSFPGTVLEQRASLPREVKEGPQEENQPDVYALQGYLRRLELGELLNIPARRDSDDEDDDDDNESVSELRAKLGSRGGQSTHSQSSRPSSAGRPSQSSLLRENFLAGRKAAPSSRAQSFSTPAPSQETEKRRPSRLRFLKEMLSSRKTTTEATSSAVEDVNLPQTSTYGEGSDNAAPEKRSGKQPAGMPGGWPSQ